MPGKRGNRRSEVLLHMSGNPTNRDIPQEWDAKLLVDVGCDIDEENDSEQSEDCEYGSR